jgi:putative ABC transport system permease protein
MSQHTLKSPARGRGVLGTQLSGAARRPARLLLTGLAVLVASFVVYAVILTQQITQRTVLDGVTDTPAAVDVVVTEGDVNTALLGKLQKLPGVAEAVGRAASGLSLGSGHLSITADPGTGPLAMTTVVQGRYPSATDEVAVTRRTAERMGLAVGAPVTVRTGEDSAKPKSLNVVGMVDVRDDYGQEVYAPLATVLKLGGGNFLQQIDLRLTTGADPDTVRSAVDAAIGTAGENRPKVLTGADARAAEAAAASDDLDEMFALAGMFVAIAVVAAGLVATSTFRIVFAQRMRQLALLRAVGAGRGSLVRALAVEGAVTGLAAGTVGVLAALAVGWAVPPIVRAAGPDIASPGVPIGPALAVIAGAVLITLLAVLSPAASAAKVAPLEALRASSTTAGRRDIGRVRLAAGLLLAVSAALLAAYVVNGLPGPDARDYNASPMLLATVGSGALAFLALMALGPVLVRPLLVVVGWPLRRTGPVGRLAVGGIGGAPRRAAAVSVVVALGVTLIAGVLVGGESLRVLMDRELATSTPADFELVADADPIPATTVAELRTRAELANVAPYRRVRDLSLGSTKLNMDANDLDLKALPTLSTLDVASGTLASTGPGSVVLSRWVADEAGLAAGDTTTLGRTGRTVPVKVAAVLPGSTPLGAGLIAAPADLDRLGVPAGANGVLADAARPGEQARTSGLKALQQVSATTKGARITVLADARDGAQRVVTAILAVALGLIGLTVVIAVVGVGTTTALSVVERVRESGLLRAVGLSRGGLKAMLTAESSLYGVIGAAIGLLLGVPYAWLTVKALGVNAPLRLPIGSLVTVFAILVLITALAGVLPARKAARTSPVAALGTDG